MSGRSCFLTSGAFGDTLVYSTVQYSYSTWSHLTTATVLNTCRLPTLAGRAIRLICVHAVRACSLPFILNKFNFQEQIEKNFLNEKI